MEQEVAQSAPRLFISYSWTSPDHEAWVLKLATDLRESGVDVILDKWDLKEGHDANAFMETMVTDPEIKRVALVCDKGSVDKTNDRHGGVGTEAQIISAAIYSAQAQDKFVAVLAERDEHGRPYLPVYYRSRIWIDLSDSTTFAENFDRLLRWIFGQPLHQKPDLGPKPSFLVEGQGISLATSSRVRRALDAIRSDRDHAVPAASEYLMSLADQLEKIRIDARGDHFDDLVMKSIESFLPYRNQAIELFLTLASYRDSPETRVALHRFFERLVPYLEHPAAISSWNDWDFDNFRFVVHELFLYAVACLVHQERFESAGYLLGTEYYVPGRSDYGRNAMVSFGVFRKYMKSLVHRNERLQLRRLSLRADLLEHPRTTLQGCRYRVQASYAGGPFGLLARSSRSVRDMALVPGDTPVRGSPFGGVRSLRQIQVRKLLHESQSSAGNSVEERPSAPSRLVRISPAEHSALAVRIF
jgi:hypothetical protein